MGSNASAAWRATKRGALMANPCYTQIHPTCIPVSGEYKTGLAVFLDFASAIQRYGKTEAHSNGIHNPDPKKIEELGKKVIEAKYGNLFEMYEKITGENPYDVPMKIFPAVHYTMGGLWVDYNLETNIPGLFALGECNFSDHGANRLGASALMQGLADGYFVIPYTIGQFLSKEIRTPKIDESSPAFMEAEKDVDGRLKKLLAINGSQSVESFHRRLGLIMWEYCGMSRNAEGLQKGRKLIQELQEEFWKDVFVPGSDDEFNPELEKATRVALALF